MSKQYTTVAGDMWDGIAFKMYGDETRMDELIQHNLAHKDVYIFPAGTVLTIPAVSAKPPAALPPWKRVGAT